MFLNIARAALLALLGLIGYTLSPRSISPVAGAVAAVAVGVALLIVERKLRDVPGHTLVGGVAGGMVGLLASRLVWTSLGGLEFGPPHLVQMSIAAGLGYLGVAMGIRRGEWFVPSRIVSSFTDSPRMHQYKILDTSVIIDGRIADICETGFLDGALVVPQFVLRELQQVADSSDSLKRNRGRRGLDILQKMQKTTGINIEIVETDFPEIREVDLKLIELARRVSGKIVTNDFNLNKVAQLRGVPVLNINELTNSLKPIVLPGEAMKVFVLKEGKEAGQGVAYLDDGTMVVVDQGKRALGRTVEVVVTSVLQTTAGKMIFCRMADAPAGEDTGRLRRERSAREYHRGVERERWTPEKPVSLPTATTSEPTPEPVSVASIQEQAAAAERSKLA
jgi:uncharacterized protein YacL